MSPEDRISVEHMIEAARAAIRFASDRVRDDLDADDMLLYALTRAIEIIGEAASRISSETRRREVAVPWGQIVGMRHRLAHGYFDIDRDMVWKTAREEIPALLLC